MKEDWIYRGPSSDELASEISDGRKGRNDILVIIPTANGGESLRKHLKSLEKQTFREFDIMIIYGKKNFISNKKLNIINVHESEKIGSAGAFYLGGRIALEEGYKTVVFADDDCIPSENLLMEINSAVGNGKKIIHTQYREKGLPDSSPNHYGAVTREVLEKIGMVYLPFFFGGEDYEWGGRLARSGEEIFTVDAGVIHTAGVPVPIISESRLYGYIRGKIQAAIMNGCYAEGLLCISDNLIIALGLFLLGKKSLAKSIFSAITDAAKMRMFEVKKEDSEPKEEKADVDFINNIETRIHVSTGEYFGFLAGYVKEQLKVLMNLGKFLNRRVLFDCDRFQTQVVMMLLTKTSYVRFMGKTYKVHQNMGIISNILGYLLINLFIPVSWILSAFFVLWTLISLKMKKIETWGYGLET